ncbi:Nuclear pore assembly and biogenesis protein APQ12 [Penicillium riverlandense]|uniref:Nuclear pore assembly and biogenesis protein APQ12 n=1 Tax=Penicillium riverlandense TaxID=1903569 RepID=UPI002548E12F|nr:Nuclear pore assembly and biogenesis protein APQ12 [Penicillium riverlandense]KAJ5832272.1 Nuclear pore assembly and biogenesis protein APQ12 [Penicillium riverlandense]
MDFLPENVQTLLQHPSVTYIATSTQEHLTTHLSHIRTAYVQPYLIQPLSSLLASTASSSSAMPDLLSILLLAIILVISLKILDYARRVIMFWVSLAFRLMFWGSILGIALYVYRVGVESAGRDLGWLWGVVEGFVEDFQARSSAATSGGGGSAGVGSGWGAGKKGKSGGYARPW